MIPKGYTGLTLFPFIFLKHRKLLKDVILLNHERIHLKQQLEMLVLPFYMFYVSEFLIRLGYYQNWKKAYRNISFEREAYTNQSNLEYLKVRPFWAFLKYLRNHDI
ncbi:hypothetical protein Q4566_14240 [Tamlana sp. 2_MG-2023]|nr:hypothetical protein [Tamlana sp. 2_MG-2023]MDO6761368.1 hypothetical protein [Tamlana sp. 2_MG-2023]MDO6792018.1 hypothetical protein [Tamlana sp. 1_MG-2023]